MGLSTPHKFLSFGWARECLSHAFGNLHFWNQGRDTQVIKVKSGDSLVLCLITYALLIVFIMEPRMVQYSMHIAKVHSKKCLLGVQS